MRVVFGCLRSNSGRLFCMAHFFFFLDAVCCFRCEGVLGECGGVEAVALREVFFFELAAPAFDFSVVEDFADDATQ